MGVNRFRTRAEQVAQDIRDTYQQVRNGPTPDGLTQGRPFRGIVPREEVLLPQRATKRLDIMFNLRWVAFRWDVTIRNGIPHWQITGSLEGVHVVVDGPRRLLGDLA